MKNSKRQRRSAYLLASPFLVLAGCNVGGPGLVDAGILELRSVPDDRGYYRDVRVYKDDAGIVVTGFVRRFLKPGHVHVAVFGLKGEALTEVQTEVHRPPASSRVRHARFKVSVDVPPAAIASVLVKHHTKAD